MSRTCSLRSAGLWLGVLALIALPGCKSDPPEVPVAETNLRAVFEAFRGYAQEASERPEEFEGREMPTSETDLHKYLKEQGYENPEEALKSPNDGQPYVIYWGIPLNEADDEDENNPQMVLAHEQHGVDGTRWVLFANGTVKRLSHADFEVAKGRNPEPMPPEDP